MIQEFTNAQKVLLDRYQIEAESRFLDVSVLDGRAHVLVVGEGPPVVMVIGGGAPAVSWASLMEQLDGFTLYAVDRPGFGLTDTTAHNKETMRSMAVAFLKQALDGLELENPGLVSNSIGALWSTWMALDEPDRVAALVHIGCPAAILDTSAPLPMRLLATPILGPIMMRMRPPSPQQADQVFAMMNEDISTLPELRDVMVACEKLPAFEPTWLDLLHSVIRLRGTRPELMVTAEQFASITQPVQLIWGEQDPFGSPEVGRRAAEIIKEGEIHVVPGGHTPWVNEAETIGELVSPFLHKHTKSSAS